jgi:hypothetical protein
MIGKSLFADADGNWISDKARLPPACGHDNGIAPDDIAEVERDQTGFGCLLSKSPDPAEVVNIPDRDKRHACRASGAHAACQGCPCRRSAKASLPVDDQDRARLLEPLSSVCGCDPTGTDLADV